MLEQYGRIGILLFFALAFPVGALVLSYALGILRLRPKNPNPVKEETYECGVETEGETWVRFNPHYYMFALLFVVFDVEVIFLYPWAVTFRQVKFFGFIEALLFVLILLVGYVYAWRKKAIEWR